jgi:hypothetical protein
MSGHFLRATYSIVAILLGVGSGTAWAQDEMFVTNLGNNSVTVYARTANGNVAPVRTIVGAATGLNSPVGLAVDTVNNELIVANNGTPSITVYARTANGNVAPLRTIAGSATSLAGAFGLGLDTVNNELVVPSQGENSIMVFARTANGNVAPLRTIIGAATGMNGPNGLTVDLVNNELAVTNNFGNSVTVYARTANGDVAPLRTIAGAATGLNTPRDLAVDTVNDELVVTSQGGDSVMVYARTANGNVAPLRTIVGAATALNSPFGLGLDTVNDELVVTDLGAASITVYARTANGNVAPLRTLVGAATALSVPAFLAITTGAEVQPAGVVEDAHATGGTISNVNNILEPGETVLVNPSWKNVSSSPLALTGMASAFTGPAGATYSLLDAAADYGTIAPGATADSFSAGGPSYRLSVSNPAPRPAVHWDATFLETLSTGGLKTWTLHVGQSFSDVPVSHGAYPFVETLLHNGITAGCGGGNYCPANNATRFQAAVFLALAMVGPGGTVPTSGTVPSVGSYDCSAGGNSLFGDVLPTDPGCRFIHYIYAQGLTAGCGGGNYCPFSVVTRWQIAVFLAAGMVGPSGTVPTSGTVPSVGTYDCSTGGNSLFSDVPPTHPGCRFIHYIYANGVTAGCGGGNYCPASNVTRWQMAPFLVTAFDIPFLH